MRSKGSKLAAGSDWESINMINKNLSRCLGQMDTTFQSLTLALEDYRELHYHLRALRDVLQASQAKPSKKRPRTAKPRTSTRHKA